MQKVLNFKVTPECRAAHPFIVVRRAKMGSVLNRFASLYCAAQTALHYCNRHGVNKDFMVVDERTGAEYEYGVLLCTRVHAIIPLEFKWTPEGVRAGIQNDDVARALGVNAGAVAEAVMAAAAATGVN